VFKAWNIVDAGLAQGSTGHNYWETKALADELLKRGVEVRIFSHKNAPKERFPGVQVHPTFSLFLYTQVSTDPSWGALENFVVHTRRFQHDLSQIERPLFQGSLTFFPTVLASQLLATIRWLAQFEDVARPKAVVTIRPPADWSDNSPAARNYRMIWADCPAAVKKNLALTVRTPETANQFHELFGVKPHVLPSPLGAPERRAQIAAKVGAQLPEPITVSFLAGMRRKRGITHIPDVVKLCMPLGIHFFIQVKDDGEPGVDIPLLTALGGLPNVKLHEGVLERDAYHDAIARSIVLIPYASDSYRWVSSGVYNEAKFLGAPVIVGTGSWMAEEVKSLGNGLVFEEHTPAAIAACIAQAQREIGKLRERAAICARKYSAENGPDRFVDAVESIFANEQP
jgi:glycosyltransferase involved in cell wall biosynthesis